VIAGLVGLAALGPLLASCGGSASSTGPVTLNWYIAADDSGAWQTAANTCSAASHGQYKISYHKLPATADEQRQDLVRRLAAHDSSLDILGLDVTWAPEFSEAGWIVPWTGTDKQEAERDALPGPLATAMWRGSLVAVPFNSNTQLLWYRSDLVPNPPTTWTQMIDDAEQLAQQGKPHYIETQGAQYEGLTVWFNTMVASAGGSILNKDSTAPSLGAPALRAMSTMQQLATSVAADPSLAAQKEDENRQAMESGTAAFELNYPFVYPAYKKAVPDLFPYFRWAPYPEVVPGTPAKVTIGGFNLAVSAYSRHKNLAFQAALCLRDASNQLNSAVVGGYPPTLRSLYAHPTAKFVQEYPFYKDILKQLETAAVRPKTPAYQNVSTVISRALSPPIAIDPPQVLSSLHSQITSALRSKG
jgi:multiple sugar transport system substrate-binding protein